MGVEEKLAFYRDVVLRNNNEIYSWVYDRDVNLLYTDCKNASAIRALLSYYNCKEVLQEHMTKSTAPIELDLPIGLLWIAVFETEDDEIKRIHAIGPVYSSEVLPLNLEKLVKDMTVSVEMKNAILTELRTLPVVSPNTFIGYARMLHYCVADERLTNSDIYYRHHEQFEQQPPAADVKKDRHRVYMIEQSILHMVREGDLNYKDIMDSASTVSTGLRINVGDPLRRQKDGTIVFIALCMRAAIEGGLSPDISYTVGDRYIQEVEEADGRVEVTAISHEMYEDFIRRVHKCRTKPTLSPYIQSCCDYIEMHVEESISIKTLSEMVGYTDYYLSKKFKQEMGITLSDYVKIVKTERAKILLRTTDTSIQDISETLSFCSRSYFSEVFKKIVGVSPGEFRIRGGKF